MDTGVLIAMLSVVVVGLGAAVAVLLVRSRRPATPILPTGLDPQLQQALIANQAATQQALQQQGQQVTQLVRTTQEELARTRTELARSLGDNQQQLQTRLAETNRTVDARLGQAAKLFSDISKGLGSVTEFSAQLANLRDVFQSPKLRGNVGEAILKELLEQVLPRANFAMQFKFREGQVVDAIVRTKQGIIPIDSKFPMENFRLLQNASREEEPAVRRTFERDVKKHIDAIASKYVLPGEGTVDFAIMYVPSEAVYYEVVQRSETLLEHAAAQRVYLVSPNTFYYFLKVVLIGLEGARMEEVSKQVLQLLRTVQKDAREVGEAFDVLSRHVTNAKNTSDKVAGKFERLTGKLEQADLLEAPTPRAALPAEVRSVQREQVQLELEVPVGDDVER
ncbi:MAG: DNA recombination protein RmuC [Candidatus Andersenbacteria bacterium]